MGDTSEMVLLDKLLELLAQENNLPGLEDEVRWLYNQFEICPHFKSDGKRQCASDTYDKEEHRFQTNDAEHPFKTDDEEHRYGWFLIQKIRKLADEAENVVGTYYRNVAAKQRTNSTAEKEPFAGYCSSDHTAKLCTLRMSVEEITRRVGNYNWLLLRRVDAVQLSKQGPWQTRSRGWAAEDEFEMVGYTEEREALVDHLMDERKQELDIKAIVGEGGTGKSTLAIKVYSDVRVQRHFRFRGWVSVSQKYRLKNLLLRILSDVSITAEDIYEMDEWELKRLLFNQLKYHKYLLVIDDLWSGEAWKEIKDVFPNNNLGSRIIVTTRWGGVASLVTGNSSSVDPIILYNRMEGSRISLRSLGYKDSWELFRRKIFGGSQKEFSHDIETYARKIVRYCNGRPIVIVVVAGILRAGEMTADRWSNIVNQFHKSGCYKGTPREILTVCYGEIPTHLKTCFLYLGVFPENFEISVKQLIQLWIAEGLLQYSVENTDYCYGERKRTFSSLEDVGEAYVKELIHRNLIQVSKMRSDGGPKSCRIHDLLRDLCIDLSPWHEKFLSVCHSKEDDSFPKNLRRLSILGDCPKYMWNSDTNPDTASDTCSSSHVLRSLSCFSQDNQSISEENWESIFRHFPLLRVLNFGEGEVGKLPEAIEELFHLRYLKVKPAENMSFPTSSVFNLWNLQTIDLRTTEISELPKEIWKMQQLRHLYLYGRSRLPKSERKDECLPNLQTLSYIEIDPDDDIGISQKAPNLRKLGLYEYQCFSLSEEKVTFDLPHLHSLKFAEECTFEEPIKLPDTITKITLKRAFLQQEMIQILKKLPNLHILKLVQTSFNDNELDFGDGSFPQLQLLKLEDSTITTWKGIMPSLHCLVISNCPLLTDVPAELCEMNTLKELELNWVSPTLARKLARDLKKKQKLKLKIYPPTPYEWVLGPEGNYIRSSSWI